MRDPFVNYFADGSRASPFNLAVVRVLLGTYLVWRVASLDWGFLQRWPQTGESARFLDRELLWTVLPYQEWVLVGLLCLFVVGYRTRWTGMLSGLLLAHMCAVKSVIYMSGTVESLIVCSYVLVLFGLFADEDVLSVDGVRQTANRSLSDLNAFLKTGAGDDYRLTAHKWVLLTLGIIYFGAAWGKILAAGVDWAAGWNLQRHILRYQEYADVSRPIGDFVVQYPELALLGNLVTIGAQATLVVAVLAKRRIGLIVVTLLGFHVLTLPLLGLRFIDNIFLLATVPLAWDSIYARVVSEESVDLVYDEHCYFCARSLYLFKLLDVTETVEFYSQYDAPEQFRAREDVDFEEEMYVFRDGKPFGGYWAFRELLRQFRIFAPLVWLMGLGSVAAVGQRVYRYVAENRNRHFTCSVDAGEQSA